jgi:putative molybdopterin biosynthesis protein
MSTEMMNTKEAAAYLGIHEKQVYALIRAKRIPCTRVTGKWLFPKHLIDEWIAFHARESVPGGMRRGGEAPRALLAAGSNDPVLDILLSEMKVSHPDLYIFSSSTGSVEGLRLLGRGHADIAWCHILDPESGDYNISYVSNNLAETGVAVVHLFYRELGFVSSPALARPVAAWSELAGKMRFINRQKGSGTRIFLDHNLREKGIDPARIRGYEREVYTHLEVGLTILAGDADAGIATVAVSKLLGLGFTPLVRESFDMVLAKETFFKGEVQAFIDTLASAEFRRLVAPLGSYDFGESGKIVHSTQ